MKQKIAIILSGIILGSGGIYVGLQKSEPLTYEEAQVLIQIYNYEIQKRGNIINLQGVVGDTLLDKLNSLVLETDETEKVKIEDNELTAIEYNNLKKTLIDKSKQKTKIEKMVEKIL